MLQRRVPTGQTVQMTVEIHTTTTTTTRSLWRHGSVGWLCSEVRDVDVGFWPYSVGLLVKLCSFLSSLHWPSAVSDLGVGGVPFVELRILYERCAGERLVVEMSVPKLRRSDRPISVSAVPARPSIDTWRSCRSGLRWFAWWSWCVHSMSLGCQSL